MNDIKEQLKRDVMPLIIGAIPRLLAAPNGAIVAAALLAAVLLDVEAGTRLAAITAISVAYLLANRNSADKGNG